MSIKQDIKFIKRCFELAENGKGIVSPNPLVGSVIVKDGKIISEGWHKKPGMPHAEAEAIANAKENLESATLYCNLEPCCHTNKRTSPCTPLIINCGIKKVVISNIDPNPHVAGKGIAQLRDTDIEVCTGMLEKEGAELNKFFFKFITHKIPYITVKIAQTVDGKINYEDGIRSIITGDEVRKDVHKLRSEYDAVLVGANTIWVDDPELTVREFNKRNPARIILSPNLNLDLTKKVFRNSEKEKVIVFCSEKIPKSKIEEFKNIDVNVIPLELNCEFGFDLNIVLDELGKFDITSILVEGGSKIFSSFIEENLFDEIIIYQAPKIFGKGTNPFQITNINQLKLKKVQQLGEDIKFIYKKNTCRLR